MVVDTCLAYTRTYTHTYTYPYTCINTYAYTSAEDDGEVPLCVVVRMPPPGEGADLSNPQSVFYELEIVEVDPRDPT